MLNEYIFRKLHFGLLIPTSEADIMFSTATVYIETYFHVIFTFFSVCTQHMHMLQSTTELHILLLFTNTFNIENHNILPKILLCLQAHAPDTPYEHNYNMYIRDTIVLYTVLYNARQSFCHDLYFMIDYLCGFG